MSPAESRGIVLVADDNVGIRRALRVGLERAGYQVYEAADGATADRIVIERQPIWLSWTW
jgi:DNA-binding response OmpR family regulator